MAPVGALLFTAMSLLGGLLDARFLLGACAYVAVCVLWGIVDAWRKRRMCLALSGPMAIVMHMAWGAGFLARLARQGRSAEDVSRSSGISRT